MKGRYDEPKNESAPDLDDLNDYNRTLYRDEVAGLIERFNQYIPASDPRLYAPDLKFNRAIGRYAGMKVDPKTGVAVDEKEYAQRIDDFLPTVEDKKLLLDILHSKEKWITPKQGARDPLETIAEPRKTAINL
jgi:hypothetical protein